MSGRRSKQPSTSHIIAIGVLLVLRHRVPQPSVYEHVEADIASQEPGYSAAGRPKKRSALPRVF